MNRGWRHLIWLDWDRAVTGIASQPFWLSWTGPDGKDVAHAPDFFPSRADGSAGSTGWSAGFPAGGQTGRGLGPGAGQRYLPVQPGERGYPPHLVPGGYHVQAAAAGRGLAGLRWRARAARQRR
jgi:hypothetical protein